MRGRGHGNSDCGCFRAGDLEQGTARLSERGGAGRSRRAVEQQERREQDRRRGRRRCCCSCCCSCCCPAAPLRRRHLGRKRHALLSARSKGRKREKDLLFGVRLRAGRATVAGEKRGNKMRRTRRSRDAGRGEGERPGGREEAGGNEQRASDKENKHPCRSSCHQPKEPAFDPNSCQRRRCLVSPEQEHREQAVEGCESFGRGAK